jgi:hypothetical protein
MGILLGGVFASALAFAFAAQWLIAPRRRTGIILAAAGAPAIVLLIIATIAALAIGGGESWFHTAVGLALFLGATLVTGRTAAILGSELASLTQWLLRRRQSARTRK